MSESFDQPFLEQSQLIAQVESSSRVNREESGLQAAVPIAVSIFAAILVIWFVKSFLRICNPNEILILSGRKHRTKSGQTVGYRVIFGGRVISIPILESVKIMDMTTMPVPVEVKNAYSKGGTPLDIQAIANVKISNNPGVVGNAIERFLDRDRKEILRVARETLEGNLRGVVALLTPEQINEDRLRFAEQIAQDVSRELVKLGLQLDTLKIQSVADDVDYLSSIGRRQIAQIVRDAEIAESNAMGEAERIEADCQQQSEVAQTQALAIVQEKQNALRKIKAELEQRAKSEEERTIAAGKEARARAEQQLQAMRADLERLRLEADEVLPAEAQRQAKELQSRGEAASLGENAKAAAQVNDMLSKVWEETGTDAAEVFLIQQIEMVLRQAAEIPNRVKLERINVIDNGDGQAIASLVNAYPEMVRQFLDRVDQTLGIDVTGTLKAQRQDQGE
ncbi:flotillin family protein [Acaryochloris sp. 'Moss Beach']|uniref:flotillin family protein n=1 Tax=Acaryochloris TaxID=155977 RepID=UPI001EFF176C|nr:SPFH domain-containing protein [Acaryochloris sp. 'Moss Beach']UJB70162.1 flotillin family protein [Acaryochloris sp. 'Moss Beach']